MTAQKKENCNGNVRFYRERQCLEFRKEKEGVVHRKSVVWWISAW
jgi:hypothetical protein